MKKTVKGKCKLCGKESDLSYEHVPPRSLFNSDRVKIVDVLDSPGLNGEETSEPWNLSKSKGHVLQQGSGGYYLCSECNNNTGAWYVPYFTNFASGFIGAYNLPGFEREKIVRFFPKKIRPLPVFKQIMTMFCDINNLCDNDENLRKFLLDKNNTDFDQNKYRVFIYIHSGELNRIHGFSVSVMSDGFFYVSSEITGTPLGFVLYKELPDELPPYFILPGAEITNFSKYEYEEEVNLTIDLPIHECNINLPCNFCSKEELTEDG